MKDNCTKKPLVERGVRAQEFSPHSTFSRVKLALDPDLRKTSSRNLTMPMDGVQAFTTLLWAYWALATGAAAAALVPIPGIKAFRRLHTSSWKACQGGAALACERALARGTTGPLPRPCSPVQTTSPAVLLPPCCLPSLLLPPCREAVTLSACRGKLWDGRPRAVQLGLFRVRACAACVLRCASRERARTRVGVRAWS